jgi:hypothetical protein
MKSFLYCPERCSTAQYGGDDVMYIHNIKKNTSRLNKTHRYTKKAIIKMLKLIIILMKNKRIFFLNIYK